MPPVLAAAAVTAVAGVGTAVYGASQQKKAAKKANAAQQAAAQQQLAAQQQNFDRIYGMNQPFVQGGAAAYDKLLQQFGIAPTSSQSPASAPTGARPSLSTIAGPAPTKTPGGPAGTSPLEPGTGAPVAPPAGQPSYLGGPQSTQASGGEQDWDAYLAANPDVAENARQRVADGTAQSVEQVAQEHWQNFGQKEGRDLPTTPYDPGGEVIVPDYINAPPPEFQRPDAMTSPDLASYFTDFQADPGYQWRVDENLRGVNAASAARGKLRSGDAAKALQDRANSLADQAYNTWVNQQLQKAQLGQNAYQYGQNRQDSVFAQDRGYGTGLWQNQRDFQTGRYDQNTRNLFGLTDVGLRGAGNVAGAGTNLANNQSNIFGNQANSTADAAYARGSANAQLGGAIGGAASNLFANWGGYGGGGGGATYTGGVQPFDPINGLY